MADDPVITGKGTANEIQWDIERKSVNALVSQVPRTRTTVPNLSKLDDGSTWDAAWSLSDDDALTLERMTFKEATDWSNAHDVCRYLQWRNFRLIQFAQDDRTITSQARFSLKGKCTEILLLNKPGKRISDGGMGKTFAWGVVAGYQVKGVKIAGLSFTIKVTQAFLFATPAGDVQPSATVIGIKVFPTLETILIPEFENHGDNTLVSFAADLKMVFAPQLTSTAQRRDDAYFDMNKLGTLVVSTHSDTNGRHRNPPGQFPPRYPDWNRLFDYAEPDIQNEFVFQAVVNSSNAGSTDPFIITKYPAPSDGTGAAMGGDNKVLECYRALGQGEFDNVHVHPYVGFDNPNGATKNDAANVNMVEAPIAADEVIHMHWRWGTKLPATADTPELAREMRGYNLKGEPNQDDGAPQLPPNQSLRIKVARPRLDAASAADDNGKDPPANTPLDRDAIALWYLPVAHRPDYLGVIPFCGHGFGLAYEWKGKAIASNDDLLDDPTAAFSYHSLRWNDGKQRIPTASTLPGLSRNRIWSNDPLFDKAKF